MSSYTKWGVGVIGVLLLAGTGFFFLHEKGAPSDAVSSPPLVEEQKGPTHEIIGHSVEGRAIDAYTYGKGTKNLLFAGGMHGGYEWNSVVLAYMFMDYLDAHADVIPAGVSVTIIPSLNPDGVYKIIGKEGRFSIGDVPNSSDESAGRFNAHAVDLNRNFDCHWQPKSTWRDQTVSAGDAAFSEPESKALRNFVQQHTPAAAVFWHSQANAVYASECDHGILPHTLTIMDAYANAAGYPAVKSFDSYKVTGDSEGWLASIDIPAITVEMKTHDTVEWEKNLAGFKALLRLYAE